MYQGMFCISYGVRVNLFCYFLLATCLCEIAVEYTKCSNKAIKGHKSVMFWYEQLKVLSLRHLPIFLFIVKLLP